jgi:hypothetical protein
MKNLTVKTTYIQDGEKLSHIFMCKDNNDFAIQYFAFFEGVTYGQCHSDLLFATDIEFKIVVDTCHCCGREENGGSWGVVIDGESYDDDYYHESGAGFNVSSVL